MKAPPRASASEYGFEPHYVDVEEGRECRGPVRAPIRAPASPGSQPSSSRIASAR